MSLDLWSLVYLNGEGIGACSFRSDSRGGGDGEFGRDRWLCGIGGGTSLRSSPTGTKASSDFNTRDSTMLVESLILSLSFGGETLRVDWLSDWMAGGIDKESDGLGLSELKEMSAFGGLTSPILGLGGWLSGEQGRRRWVGSRRQRVEAALTSDDGVPVKATFRASLLEGRLYVDEKGLS